MNEISIDKKSSDELLKMQQQLAQAQAQITEIVIALAAYGALPASLQQLAAKIAGVVKERDEQIKKIAALAGVDLDSPEAGRWSWDIEANVIRRLEGPA